MLAARSRAAWWPAAAAAVAVGRSQGALSHTPSPGAGAAPTHRHVSSVGVLLHRSARSAAAPVQPQPAPAPLQRPPPRAPAAPPPPPPPPLLLRSFHAGVMLPVGGSVDMPPGSQFLASLVDYEVSGLPRVGAAAASAPAPSRQAAAADDDAPAASAAAAVAGAGGPLAPPPAGPAYDLARMRRLLRSLGDPQQRYPVVHVAGSKGKGSVVALLSCVLRAAGLKVGTYTSPHLVAPQERIQGPDGRPVSAEQWEQLAQAVRAAALSPAAAGEGVPGGSLPITHFEAVTAMALQHFADQRVDVAVVETGMGGRHDATNVFSPERLLAAVVTRLGWEHVAALGGSLESIAAAKAGIFKRGRPAVVAQQTEAAVRPVLLQEARQLGCSLVHAEEAVEVLAAGPITVDPTPGPSMARQAVSVTATTTSPGAPHQAPPPLQLRDVPVRLVGGHQRSNIQAAVACVLQLRRQGWEVPDAAVVAGLEQAWLPGRFQVLQREGWSHHLLLDGAHTADSAAALAAAVREAFPEQPVVLVVAMAADKEHREVVAALRKLRPKVVVFTAVPIAGGMQRAAPPGTLAAHWQAAAMLSADPPFRCRELIQASLGAALQKARHELGAFGGQGVVLVTGSLHAVGAALKAL